MKNMKSNRHRNSFNHKRFESNRYSERDSDRNSERDTDRFSERNNERNNGNNSYKVNRESFQSNRNKQQRNESQNTKQQFKPSYHHFEQNYSKLESEIQELKAGYNEVCQYCGQSVNEIASSFIDSSSNKPVHFDCVLNKIAESEKLEAGDKVSYIGQGRFGIINFPNVHDVKHFTIKKIIEWETKDNTPDWRKKMADLYSQIK